MTQDFSAFLQQEIKNTDNNDGDGPTRKNEVIKLNATNQFFGRILPLGNRWFATEIKQVFVDITKKDKTTAQIALNFPTMDKENNKIDLTQNRLYSLINDMLQFNKSQGRDVAPLQMAPQYPVSLRNRYVVLAVNVNNAQGHAMELDTMGYPVIRQMTLAKGTYNTILKRVQEKYSAPAGGQFDNLGFISPGVTYPVGISFDKPNSSYDVSVRADIQDLAGMPQDYLAREADDSDYVHADDPWNWNQPISGDFEERVYGELVARYNRALQSVGQTTMAPVQSNPFVAQQAPAQTNPYAGQAQPQAPVTPQAPAQPQAPTWTPQGQAPVAPIANPQGTQAPQGFQGTVNQQPVTPQAPAQPDPFQSNGQAINITDDDLPFSQGAPAGTPTNTTPVQTQQAVQPAQTTTTQAPVTQAPAQPQAPAQTTEQTTTLQETDAFIANILSGVEGAK